MPILERRAGQSATRCTLLTSGFGLLFGLLFGLPPAYAGYAMGLSSASWSIGTLGMGMFAGFLLAFLVVHALMEWPESKDKERVCPQPIVLTLPRPAEPVKSQKCLMGGLRSRLAKEKECLDRLESERTTRQDPAFERLAEQRIIWSELLELELQDIDEQFHRICRETAVPGGNPGKGEPYGRDCQ